MWSSGPPIEVQTRLRPLRRIACDVAGRHPPAFTRLSGDHVATPNEGRWCRPVVPTHPHIVVKEDVQTPYFKLLPSRTPQPVHTSAHGHSPSGAPSSSCKGLRKSAESQGGTPKEQQYGCFYNFGVLKQEPYHLGPMLGPLIFYKHPYALDPRSSVNGAASSASSQLAFFALPHVHKTRSESNP